MFLSLFVVTLGTLAKPAFGAACVDVIGIEASPQDQRDLRKLLRRGSLSSLSNESCRDYQVKLSRGKDQGWTVSMASRSSTRKFERQVTKLSYAATWIEAWTQSGFAATVNEPESAPKELPAPAVAVPSVASTPASIFLGLEPLVAVTSRGYGLVGTSLFAGYPAHRSPWFGFELGLATQFDTDGADYRRAYWAGPMVGGSLALSEHLRLRPAVSLGVMGSAASIGGQSANAASLYAGISADVELDVTEHLALSAGFDARLLFENLSGASNSTVTQIDDDGEVETSNISTVTSSLGQVWCALRLGVVWHFGGAS